MLGLPASALEELERMDRAARRLPAAQEIEWQTRAAGNDWDGAWQVAQAMVEQSPRRAFGWVHRAYALRRKPGGGLEPAWEALLPAADKFPRNFLIPYNLACYAAQLHRLEEAWEWLQRSVRLAGAAQIRALALADEDLEPLRTRIEALPCQ